MSPSKTVGMNQTELRVTIDRVPGGLLDEFVSKYSINRMKLIEERISLRLRPAPWYVSKRAWKWLACRFLHLDIERIP